MNRTAKKVERGCSCNPYSSPSFICTACHTLFCHQCAKLIGIPSVCVCTECGSLCAPYQGFLRNQIIQADKDSTFGIADFKSALRFPFHECHTYLGLAVIYGALLFSFPFLFVSAIGLTFSVLGILPALMATCLLFGCNLRVINVVKMRGHGTKGVLDTSEMLADIGEIVASSCGILLSTMLPLLICLLFARRAPIGVWIAVGWLFFYYPPALILAASAHNLWEIINPLNGLKVIRAYQSGYSKFFIYYFVTSALVWGLIGTTFVDLLKSLSGNPVIAFLPISVVLMVILGAIVFYWNLIISYMIGRMEYKAH